MKKSLRLTLLLTTLVAGFVACEKDNPNNNSVGNDLVERVIVYTVGDKENRVSLKTEAEWDNTIDQLCDQVQSGNEISFYNISHATLYQKNKRDGAKESRTIRTANREEIKHWMKEMERQGLTVRVSYDNVSGSWHGEAYTTAPVNNTMSTILGTWHFKRTVVSQLDTDGHLYNSNVYEPESNGGSMYYTFSSDGTITLTINSMDGFTATDNGTWTISNDGVLHSELLPNGEYWYVNWITPNTMILSHSNFGTETDSTYYQLHFESITTIDN